jgi:cysteine desulfurase
MTRNIHKTYLDYASATPIDKRVLKLMSSYEKSLFANATSIHSGGVKSRAIIEESREKIAKGMNAHSDEIIFTGSSTESIAMVILGVVNNYQLNNKSHIPHIITSKIEHPAVLMNFKLLEERGKAEVTYIKVDEVGVVNLKDIRDSIKENTALVSIMYANNEIGTIEPIQEIAKAIRHYKKSQSMSDMDNKSVHVGHGLIYPLFHTDATQAINYLDVSNVEKLGVDMLSFNGSKIYGPKGVGVLYKKRGIKLSPIYSGGEQEFGLRSGTENVSSIAGLALAFEIANTMKKKESTRLTKLRDYAIDKLLKINNDNFKIVLNGDKKNRLPNNINISISDISSELLVIELDAKGIEVSAKSACKSGEDDESYVITEIRKAKGETHKVEEGSLRITLGRDTKKTDIDKFILTLTKILDKYRKWKK